MRLVSIQYCKPGMRLARSIYNEDGLILLGEHVELTSSLIQRLQQLGVHRIYIEDSRTEDLVIHDPLSEATRAEALKTIRSNYKSFMEEAKNGRLVSNPHLGRDFRRLIDLILDELKQHDQAMIMLSSIQATDFYLYQHSLNVSLYAIMLGKAMGYTRDQLSVLALGAMLHDIGKTQVPESILMKPGPLTDEEMVIMRKHAEDGFRMLKDVPNIPLIAAHCALQHHERLNGSGYPRGILGDEIHEYGQLLGIVDTFDAMTTHRVYRPAALPHEAVEVLYTGAGTLFDPQMISLFRDRVAIYPPGTTVVLSNGEVGVVVDINASMPHRPVVRILTDAEGVELSELYEIDLSKKIDITIVKVSDNIG